MDPKAKEWNFLSRSSCLKLTHISLQMAESHVQDILYKLGITDVPDSKVEILRILYKKLTDNLEQNKETLLIIDEAEFIAGSTLEEIRLFLNYQLSNRFLLTIFLGQPELVDKVKAIKQLAQRVEISYFLRSFNFKETTDYIFFREKRAGLSKNVFSKQAIEIIFEHSKGIPRIINNLCDLSLLVGSGEKKTMITYDRHRKSALKKVDF